MKICDISTINFQNFKRSSKKKSQNDLKAFKMWLSHANVFIHRWIMSLPALLRLRGSSTELILAVFGSWIFYCSFVMISLRLEMVWYVLNYIKSAFKRNLDESFVGPGSYWWGQFQGQRLLLCVFFFNRKNHRKKLQKFFKKLAF